MKKNLVNLLAWPLALCFALSGCARTNPPDMPELDTTRYDYSGHDDPNEALYETTLADPTELWKGKPILVEHEPYVDESGMQFDGFSFRDENWGYDARNCDISGEDLSVVENFSDIAFNSDTIWPENIPGGFDPAAVLECNKNPGLGIRALHEHGITGKGVGIAIIDQPVQPDHEQYRDNLMYYEKIHCRTDIGRMHGAAVTSIAVGKDTGVAPGAKVYYIASDTYHFTEDGGYEDDASIEADCIMRVLDINRCLGEEEKIRVISISKGYMPTAKGYEEYISAIDAAKEENVFVITTDMLDRYPDFPLAGMRRDYLADPDSFESYYPASWLGDYFYEGLTQYEWVNDILVPMGSHTYAAYTGPSDYEINHDGGASWGVPWCAGFYALCCQVDPDITHQEFIDVVTATGVTAETAWEGQTYPFGKIIDPAAVIAELQNKTAQ